MVLEKNFVFYPDKGLLCTNVDDVKRYVENKAEVLRDYNNYTSKEKRLDLLQEILEMYNEDIVAPDIDMSPMSNCLYSGKIGADQMLMYYDFICVLGAIIYDVFDYDKNRLKYVEEGTNGPISTAEMFSTAYKELHRAKEENISNAYGATLILVTILESELRRKFKARFISEKTVEVEQRIAENSFSPTEEQRELLDCLEAKETAKMFNRVYAEGNGAYELFKAAGVLNIENEQKPLLLNTTTLNQLLGYSIFTAEVEPAFLETMKILFQTGKLNLRNDIAHGSFGYKNYYHLTVTSMLYFMCAIIIDDNFWK